MTTHRDAEKHVAVWVLIDGWGTGSARILARYYLKLCDDPMATLDNLDRANLDDSRTRLAEDLRADALSTGLSGRYAGALAATLPELQSELAFRGSLRALVHVAVNQVHGSDERTYLEDFVARSMSDPQEVTVTADDLEQAIEVLRERDEALMEWVAR